MIKKKKNDYEFLELYLKMTQSKKENSILNPLYVFRG